MDVLAVAAQGALVLQAALGGLRRRFGRLRLRQLALAAGLLGVRAKVCGVQAVSCGDDGAGRSLIDFSIRGCVNTLKHPLPGLRPATLNCQV